MHVDFYEPHPPSPELCEWIGPSERVTTVQPPAPRPDIEHATGREIVHLRREVKRLTAEIERLGVIRRMQNQTAANWQRRAEDAEARVSDAKILFGTAGVALRIHGFPTVADELKRLSGRV